MTSGDLSSAIFVSALIYYVLFSKKIKCPECEKNIKTITYAQLGAILFIMRGSAIAYDLMTGGRVNYYFEMLFLTPALYYLCSEPKFYCRHCMKGIPFKTEYIIK